MYERPVWKILETDEYQDWFETVDDSAKEDIRAKIQVLGTFGPSLGRPQVDTVKRSRFPNMKELRVKSKGRPFRILFAFDRKRRAVLLIGGNKAGSGDKDFYAVMIPLADRLFADYLEATKNEKD